MFPGNIVQIFDESDPLQSDTTLLVASLLTLGIPAFGNELFHATCEMVGGGLQYRVCWSLRGSSPDNRFDAVKMQRAWSDGAWLLANAQHPLAILRGGLTFHRAFHHTPKYTADERTILETPETWLETACYNLIYLLREMPKAAQASREVVRFGPRWLALVPQNVPDAGRTKLLKHVEIPRENRPDKKAA